MKGLVVFCEGPTERGFCNQLLRPHLFPHYEGVFRTILIAHSKHHGQVSRGGVPAHYVTLRRDISNELNRQESPDVSFTTMIDIYGLPRGFPGKDRAVRNPSDPVAYAQALEEAFEEDINDRRFVPYLQLHEYETLLFAEPDSFRIAFEDCDRAIEELKKIADSFPTIEHIDDGPTTAPSKRIIDLLPAYGASKPSAGPDIAEFTGLPAIRAKCPHFDGWLTRLESILHA